MAVSGFAVCCFLTLIHPQSPLTDSSAHKHVTLKIGTSKALERELKALRHIQKVKTQHAGSLLVRQMLDEFQINTKNGNFQCIVHPPLSTSLSAFRRQCPERALPIDLLKLILMHVLLSIDYLHSEAKVIHTGQRFQTSQSTDNH